MIDNIIFYLPQIFIGTIVGILTAIIGIIVILRKTIFMGITLSQSITVAIIISLLLEIHLEGVVHILSIILFLPLYLYLESTKHKEAILASGFVFYAAAGQILTIVGANVQNHVVTAYFGNILLLSEKEWLHIIFPFLIILALFIFFYRWILAVSFDKEYAMVANLPVKLIESIYFIILTAILSTSIYFMGSFYSIAHLIIPGFIGIQIAKNLKFAFLIAILISMSSTIIGFIISLMEINLGNQLYHLPTSSMIIIILSLHLVLLIFRKK